MTTRRSGASTLSPASRITSQIVARLEAGTRPWIKPWRGVAVSRPLRVCGTPYKGINVFWLWMVADLCGFGSPTWMTYNQARNLGGQVRKGAKATIAVFYKSYTKEVAEPATGETSEEARRVLKATRRGRNRACALREDIMGRSVSYPSGAIVAFAMLEVEVPEDWEFEFDWMIDDLRRRAGAAFPSLVDWYSWRGREDRILMRNAFADFGVSVYEGVVAIWMAEREDAQYCDADARTARSPRARSWLAQIAPRFDALFGELDLLGRFSNGEAIFRRRQTA